MAKLPPVKNFLFFAPGKRMEAAKLADFAVSRGSNAVVSENILNTIPNETNLIVAMGGDGTFLAAARATSRLVDFPKPIMGINLGHLGFLSAYPYNEAEQGIIDAIEGKLEIEERMRLHVRTTEITGHVSHKETTDIACNDVYIKHGTNPRLLTLRVSVGHKPMAVYKADGLIVSTAMGSTAYNLAVGGPILSSTLRGMVISPICPHSLTHRPVVVSADEKITIEYEGTSQNRLWEEYPCTISKDGVSRDLEIGSIVSIQADPKPLLVVPPAGNVFQVLSSKLGWDGKFPNGVRE